MIIISIVVGYLLGSLPIAERISRRGGIDIFSAGTRLAGASNVRREVGNRSAALVLAGDVGKGALAVISGQMLGVDGPWLLLPAGAAIVGHWNSVFTGFRGGDALATFAGIIIAMFPTYGIVGVAVAAIVSLGGQRIPYSSLLNIVLGYIALALMSFAYDGDRPLTFGCGVLAALVLAHAVRGHRRRSRHTWREGEEADQSTEQPGFRS